MRASFVAVVERHDDWPGDRDRYGVLFRETAADGQNGNPTASVNQAR